MILRSRCAVAAVFLCLLLPALPVFAQDDDTPSGPVYAVSTHHCDWSQLSAVIEHDRANALPVSQTLVDEGTVRSAGAAVHNWGDEWNYVTWMSASDMNTLLAGYEEMMARYVEAVPDDSLFATACPTHRDNFYQQVASTQSPEGDAAMADTSASADAGAPVLAISYYSCHFPSIDAVVEMERTRNQPIAQSLVDDGQLMSRQAYTHIWGDEWNYVVTQSARDMPALFEALNLASERYQAEYSESALAVFEEHCFDHKDNIYTITMGTE